MHSGYKVCCTLKENEKCFCLFEYDKGEFIELFHEHIPKHRISNENSVQFIKTLLIQHSDFGNSEIMRTYINKRGKSPGAIKLCQTTVEYPVPGVLRKYFSNGAFTAWYDEVISKSVFSTVREG